MDVMQDSIKRVAHIMECKVYIQQMVFMANGLESNTSKIVENKF